MGTGTSRLCLLDAPQPAQLQQQGFQQQDSQHPQHQNKLHSTHAASETEGNLPSNSTSPYPNSVEKMVIEHLIDRVREAASSEWPVGVKQPPANLQLQIDQRILGPSQRSAQESAGSAKRLRCSFISRYHMKSQGCPANEKCFNALKP